MQAVYPKVLWADAFAIGCPVYWWGPAAQTKLFIDRWYAFDARREALRGKPLLVVSTHNSSSLQMAEHVFGMFRSIAGYLGMPLVATRSVVARPPGRLAEDAALMGRARELGGRSVGLAGRSAIEL